MDTALFLSLDGGAGVGRLADGPSVVWKEESVTTRLVPTVVVNRRDRPQVWWGLDLASKVGEGGEAFWNGLNWNIPAGQGSRGPFGQGLLASASPPTAQVFTVQTNETGARRFPLWGLGEEASNQKHLRARRVVPAVEGSAYLHSIIRGLLARIMRIGVVTVQGHNREGQDHHLPLQHYLLMVGSRQPFPNLPGCSLSMSICLSFQHRRSAGGR